MGFREWVHERQQSDPEFARDWEASEPSVEVAALVISLRADLGLTQAALAERCGLKRSYIARLESGEANPTVGTLVRILRSVGSDLTLTRAAPRATAADKPSRMTAEVS